MSNLQTLRALGLRPEQATDGTWFLPGVWLATDPDVEWASVFDLALDLDAADPADVMLEPAVWLGQWVFVPRCGPYGRGPSGPAYNVKMYGMHGHRKRLISEVGARLGDDVADWIDSWMDTDPSVIEGHVDHAIIEGEWSEWTNPEGTWAEHYAQAIDPSRWTLDGRSGGWLVHDGWYSRDYDQWRDMSLAEYQDFARVAEDIDGLVDSTAETIVREYVRMGLAAYLEERLDAADDAAAERMQRLLHQVEIERVNLKALSEMRETVHDNAEELVEALPWGWETT